MSKKATLGLEDPSISLLSFGSSAFCKGLTYLDFALKDRPLVQKCGTVHIIGDTFQARNYVFTPNNLHARRGLVVFEPA